MRARLRRAALPLRDRHDKFANVGSTDEAALKSLDAAQAIVLSTAAPLEQAAQSISGPVLLPKPLEDDDEAKESHG